jgi:hypothetical protein
VCHRCYAATSPRIATRPTRCAAPAGRVGELSALPHLAIDEAVEERAVEAQRQLARIGHHRLLPPVDVLIAALADRHGVLHHDRDYDVLAERTDLAFESRWLPAPGTI